MPKKKPKPLPLRTLRNPEGGRAGRRAVIHGCLAILCLSGIAAGAQWMKRYVERDIAFSTDPLIVVIKNRPRWMTDTVVDQLVAAARPAGGHSAFDHQLLLDVDRALSANPWVAHVNQVRRAYTNKPGDTLEIDCEYRVPVALVRWGAYYWLIDREGRKLPEQFPAANVPREVMGEDDTINLRIIDGVRKPPPEIAHKWAGEDLAAGLEMLGVLFNRPYTEDILKIDVGNLHGRIDPKESQIVLTTRFNTRIYWGRLPSDKDAFIEVRPEQKLDYLKTAFERTGRSDMKQPWIDLRFDGMRIGRPRAGACADRSASLMDVSGYI